MPNGLSDMVNRLEYLTETEEFQTLSEFVP